MSTFESIADLVLIVTFVATLGYVGSCVLYPYKACPRCEGTGRIFGPLGGIRFCRVCGATGLQLRFGRRVWHHVQRLYRDIRNFRNR